MQRATPPRARHSLRLLAPGGPLADEPFGCAAGHAAQRRDRIDLTEGPGRPAIRRRFVNLADHTDRDVRTDALKREIATSMLPIQSFRWSGRDKIAVQTHGRYWLKQQFELLLP
ncbi:MAG: hypothetical protein AMXMBFR13_11020 [Phycisphaerae bacterium]